MARYKKSHSKWQAAQTAKRAAITYKAIADKIGNGRIYMPSACYADNWNNLASSDIEKMNAILNDIEAFIILNKSCIMLYKQLHSCIKRLLLANITYIEDTLYARIEKINASLRLHKELELPIEAIAKLEGDCKFLRDRIICKGNSYDK